MNTLQNRGILNRSIHFEQRQTQYPALPSVRNKGGKSMYLKTKRMLSVLLALVLVLSLFVPTAVEASGQNADGMKSSAETSPKEYTVNKQAYALQATSAAVLNGHIMSNDYIEYAVNLDNGRFTVGTTGGNPDLVSDDNKLMLYGHSNPGTSYTSVYANGSSYIYGDSGFVTAPYFEGDSNISVAQFGDIQVKQIISIAENTSTMREDVVEVTYIVTNTGSTSASIGLRIMMDTMLGSNDAAPFRIPGVGDVTTEMEFSGSTIPQYWQAFDSLTEPTVVSYGNFVSGPIKPNKVQFTNWGHVYNQAWNYSINQGSSNGDSAVSVIWERTLDAGAQETYSTRYGLSELLQDLQPPLGLTIASGSSVQIDSEKGEYLPYTITAYIQNVGNGTAENVYCNITLPEGLEFVDANETGEIFLGNMEVNELVTVEKQIKVTEKNSGAYCTQYSVTVSADNATSKTLTKQLNIDPLPNGPKAIIIVHGIAAGRLFLSEKVNTKNYLEDISDEFMTFTEYYDFDSGYQIWDPYTSTLGKVAALINQNKVQSEVLMARCDENGESIAKTYVNSPSTEEYGAQSTYEALVKELVKTYGEEYTVRFFSYDWRMSNADSAAALEEYINKNNFSSVTLVAHSMGGIVASEYLRRSTDNQEKVDKLITLGTPYLGAPKALYVLETGNFLNAASNFFCMATPLKLAVPNFYGVYQLLPDDSYFSLNDTTYVEHSDTNGWKLAKKTKYNYSQTYDLIAGRDWAKKSDGTVKVMLSSADEFYDGLFLPNGKHITSTVDTYVVIGYGKNTIMELREEFNKDGKFKKCKDITTLNGGDGTVPVISANIGGLAPTDQTYYVKDEHSDLPKNNDVIQLVKNIIDGNPDTFASSISKTLPKKDGLIKKIKLKIECPVTLSLLDENGETWAYVSENILYNDNHDLADLYVLGENNDTKIAYLEDMDYDVLLTGTDSGTMTYTASVFEDDLEVQRVVFKNVSITKDTLIHADTDFESGLLLEVDEDGDGNTDYVLEPDLNVTGTDLENELEEHYHTCETPVFTWAEDHSSCTATFTCVDGDASETVDCAVAQEATGATHTEDGQITYTATVDFYGDIFTDVRTLVIPASGHDYGNPVFAWSEDYSSCTATFTCADDDGSETVDCTVTKEITDATHTGSGQIVYTASVVFGENTYADIRIVEIPAEGHIYNTPEFIWNEDHTECTAVFTCSGGDDVQTIACEVEIETTPATETEDGQKICTATVEFQGTIYSDTWTEDIPATGENECSIPGLIGWIIRIIRKYWWGL